MVAISIAASALSAAVMFYLGKSMFGTRTGVIAGLFLASSRSSGFMARLRPHTLDALLVIVSVWWMYETAIGNDRFLYPATVALAVAGGSGPRHLFFSLHCFCSLCVMWVAPAIFGRDFRCCDLLLWFIPLIVLSGGLSSYLNIMGAFSRRFQETTSVFSGAGWWGLRRNLIKLVLYSAYGWSVALIPAVIYFGVRAFQAIFKGRRLQDWTNIIFIFLWVAPSMFFYLLIHMGQQGLVFVFLPALMLMGAYGLERLLSNGSRWFAPVVALLVLINTSIFSLLPEYPLGEGTQRFLTRDTIVNSDTFFRERFEVIKNNFPPESTVLLAANWHHLEYYLPEYARYRSAWQQMEKMTACLRPR
jgi:hypothetical protein